MIKNKLNLLIVLFCFFSIIGTRTIAAGEDIIPQRPRQKENLFDFAKIIKDYQKNINALLGHFKEQFGIEFVIVTVEQLHQQKINDFANQLFNEWQIGKKTDERGILLLFADKEKMIRFEVGYELEDVYPDAYCHYIEYELFKGQFESGHLAEGLMSGLETIVNKTWEKIDDGTLVLERQYAQKLGIEYLSGGAGAKMKVKLGEYQQRYLDEMTRQLYSAGSTPEETYKIYIRSLENSIRDPELGIYTERTKLFFGEMSVTTGQQRNTLRTIENVPYEIKTKGRFATVVFPKENTKASPYFLIKNPEGWQIDFVTMCHAIRFDLNNDWFLWDRNNPYMLILDEAKSYKELENYARVPAGDLREQIGKYRELLKKGPENFEANFRLGKIYSEELSMTWKAIPLLAKAQDIDPQNLSLCDCLAKAYYNKNDFDKAIEQYKKYIKLRPNISYGYNWLSFLYVQKRQYKEAIKWAKKCLKIAPKNTYAYYRLSSCYKALGKLKEAQIYLEKAKSIE